MFDAHYYSRIKCALTGHEMVPKRAVVEQHMKGQKFVRLAKEWKAPNPEFEELRFGKFNQIK
jgi:hypothetical protein